MSKTDAIHDEIRYLRDLLKPTKDGPLDWAQVSAPCLRYLLACERMQSVLGETKKLGPDSPLRTATEFAEAEHAKHEALETPHD